MIVIFAAIVGAIVGFMVARRRKGRTADMLQYACVYALIFALAALFVTIMIQRATLL
jgi:uncharacterized membrane protein YgdD (TMEM256/DUF423 family)